MPRRNRERDRSILWHGLFTEMTFFEIAKEFSISTTNARRVFFREAQICNRALYAEIHDQYNTRVDMDALAPHRMILQYHAVELFNAED